MHAPVRSSARLGAGRLVVLVGDVHCNRITCRERLFESLIQHPLDVL